MYAELPFITWKISLFNYFSRLFYRCNYKHSYGGNFMDYQKAKEVYATLSEEQIEAAEMISRALSCLPMTGRYGKVNDLFSEVGSEFALNRNRLEMEIAYLNMLCDTIGVKISEKEQEQLYNLIEDFEVSEFFEMKAIEATTKHDVKAVEYYIRGKLDELGMSRLKPYVHMGLTSEDVNNIAYALMMNDCLDQWNEKAIELIEKMHELAERTKAVPMLGHTHGQPATPLTFGHAVAVDWSRLEETLWTVNSIPIYMKLNGAVGNRAAMSFAYPDIDWGVFEANFVESFGEEFLVNPLTSQIECHDYIVRILNEIRLFSSIVENIGKNIEDYTCLKYLKQIPKAGEVGSSTMPHKINPIDGENAWSNAITAEFAAVGLTQKLPQSKMQRDLSDSSSLRTIPTVFLHSYQSMVSLIRMLGKLEVNEDIMRKDLDENPEVLAEVIQTILRKNGHDNAYEIMKEMTRGKKTTLEDLREFIKGLEIDENDKERLLKLTPAEYVGESEQLVEYYCYPITVEEAK